MNSVYLDSVNTSSVEFVSLSFESSQVLSLDIDEVFRCFYLGLIIGFNTSTSARGNGRWHSESVVDGGVRNASALARDCVSISLISYPVRLPVLLM